jgi:hypothetical protein
MDERQEREKIEGRLEALEEEVARLRTGARLRSIRRRADWTIAGLPAYDIALGPDPEKGEWRGHTRGFLAIGDMATGVIALGGLARGVVALGGLSVGVFSFGGLALGVALAVGGGAIGGLAIGGAAGGGVAIGGGAVGYYAYGGGAWGQNVISAERRDPEAEELLQRYHLPVMPPPARRRP